MADREETITAASRRELDELLATHPWLYPVQGPRRVPGGRDWFVRVRANDGPMLFGRLRPHARLPWPAVAAIVAGVLVLLAGVVVAVWWLLDQVVAHWPVVVGVVVVVGWVWVKVKRPAGKGGG